MLEPRRLLFKFGIIDYPYIDILKSTLYSKMFAAIVLYWFTLHCQNEYNARNNSGAYKNLCDDFSCVVIIVNNPPVFKLLLCSFFSHTTFSNSYLVCALAYIVCHEMSPCEKSLHFVMSSSSLLLFLNFFELFFSTNTTRGVEAQNKR